MATSARFRAIAAPVTAALTLACVCTVGVAAQRPSTLAEVAKKEEERRKAIKAPAKVYTNKDLPKGAVNPPQPATAAAGASRADQKAATQKPDAQKEGPKEEKKEDKDEKDEAWWRQRMTNARNDLQRNELAAEAFQSRVNALTTDFVNRDDPYQRAQIAIDRQKALGELERVKAEMVRLKQVIADIEEEARVAGVPPGWLR